MLIIGHRGAKGLAPENTKESIQAALDHKVDAIEFDIHTSSDGVAILHHDSHMTNWNNKKLKIAKTRYAVLKETKENMITLDEALKLIGDKASVVAEIKKDAKIEPAMKLLKRVKIEKLIIASKSIDILKQVHEEHPKIQLAVIESWSGVRAGHRARKVGTKIIIMNHLWLWGGFIASVKRSGYTLYAYTLDDPKKAKRWTKSGLAGAVTDYPDRY